MSEANWYVVHTYSGYENKVKVDIEKTIENRKLQDQILEVSVPMQDVVEIKNGAQKQVAKKMFPGYVLIHMVMNDDTWYVVRNTRGVTGFVGPGSKTDKNVYSVAVQINADVIPSHYFSSPVCYTQEDKNSCTLLYPIFCTILGR